jgi:hypothetical protein
MFFSQPEDPGIRAYLKRLVVQLVIREVHVIQPNARVGLFYGGLSKDEAYHPTAWQKKPLFLFGSSFEKPFDHLVGIHFLGSLT